MDPKTDTCQHAGCDCPVGADAVMRNGEAYCSERCADDRGCDHPDCNCGDCPEGRPSRDQHAT